MSRVRKELPKTTVRIFMFAMRSLLIVLMAICCFFGTAVSDDFLKIDLNGQLERLYGNNSDDITLETDQKEQQNWDIGQPSNQDESNDIPSGLSERSYQKYNRLLHKLKFGKVIGDEQVAPTEIDDVPTTEEMSNPVQTTSTTLASNQPSRREKIDEMTDVDEDYGIIIMDESQQLQPILAPSGLGFFHGLINFVRWLITSSAVVQLEDYEDE